MKAGCCDLDHCSGKPSWYQGVDNVCLGVVDSVQQPRAEWKHHPLLHRPSAVVLRPCSQQPRHASHAPDNRLHLAVSEPQSTRSRSAPGCWCGAGFTRITRALGEIVGAASDVSFQPRLDAGSPCSTGRASLRCFTCLPSPAPGAQ